MNKIKFVKSSNKKQPYVFHINLNPFKVIHVGLKSAKKFSSIFFYRNLLKPTAAYKWKPMSFNYENIYLVENK